MVINQGRVVVLVQSAEKIARSVESGGVNDKTTSKFSILNQKLPFPYISYVYILLILHYIPRPGKFMPGPTFLNAGNNTLHLLSTSVWLMTVTPADPFVPSTPRFSVKGYLPPMEGQPGPPMGFLAKLAQTVF